jgi:hypothetical protein
MYLPSFLAIASGLKTDIAHVGFSLTDATVSFKILPIIW